jgi:anti-sigma B factor antagonist
VRFRLGSVDRDSLELTTVALDENRAKEHSFRVVARGEIDVATAPKLTAALDELIAQGVRLVVLDAADVEFMDSSGLRVIVQSGTKLSEAGGRLLIDGMSGAVQRVLEIAGMLEQYRAT